MFKRGFNKFLERDISKPEIYPYVYSVGLGGLTTTAKKKVSTQPIKCSQCGAILTKISSIKEDAHLGAHYSCEYCGTVNVIDKEQITETLPDDIDFILEDIKPKEPKTEEKITGVSATVGELYISIIDISGSMSGGKIEAVKKSLVQTLKDYKINSPTTKYILIAFESSVYYYLRHDDSAVNFGGDVLYNVEMMRKEFENSFKTNDFVGSIGEFAEGWVEKVQGLRSMDMTALGPALFLGILSFERFSFPSGRITLLTDGLANQGIGNLSGTSPGAQKFYEDMADLCNKLNIVVDVVGVSSLGDNNEMGLQTLGKVTDSTGGQLFLITSEEMEAIFSELRQISYVGKDVKVRVITPKNITIKNVTGAYSSKSVQQEEINLGAVTDDRELYVELDPSRIDLKEGAEIPVQLQVEYKDNEGRKRLRVINDRVSITKDEKEFKAAYDQNLNVMMNIQQAGTRYYAGKAEDSKIMLKELKKKISKEMEALQGAGVSASSFKEGLSYLDDELEEIAGEEEQVAQAPKASFQAAKGQVRARLSKEKLKKRMEEKQK